MPNKDRPNFRLFARYFSGECSKKENEKIEQWIKSNPENSKTMTELERIWKVAGQDADEFDALFNPEEGWGDIETEIALDGDKGGRQRAVIRNLSKNYSSITKTNFSQFLRVAAIILVASLLGILAYQNLYQEPEIVKPVLREIAVEKGQRGNITLSDGTKVTLNADSKITLPNVFKSDKREITLEGQAFFDVTSNPERPFIINTGDAIVKVLGTSLDVESYPDDESVRVVVKEGRVSLNSKNRPVNKNTILSAGEMGRLLLADQRINKQKVEDFDLFLGWKSGFLKFKDTPMREVAEDLERKYDMAVKFKDDQLKELRLTAELKSHTLKHNMDVISTSLGVNHRINREKKMIVFSQRTKTKNDIE